MTRSLRLFIYTVYMHINVQLYRSISLSHNLNLIKSIYKYLNNNIAAYHKKVLKF